MIKQLIANLPQCEIPRRYGWRDRDAIDLKDIGYTNVCDCLNKAYTRECDPFPQDFDSMLLYRILGGYLKFRWKHAFLDTDPTRIILGQRYVKRSRLLELLDKPNSTPIRGVKIGDYTIVHDGHHRVALKHLRKSRVYARIKEYYYDD